MLTIQLRSDTLTSPENSLGRTSCMTSSTKDLRSTILPYVWERRNENIWQKQQLLIQRNHWESLIPTNVNYYFLLIFVKCSVSSFICFPLLNVFYYQVKKSCSHILTEFPPCFQQKNIRLKSYFCLFEEVVLKKMTSTPT